MKKNEKGITLIALIITVIILVILAAVSVRAIVDMQIVEHAVNGSQKYVEESLKENNVLGETTNLIEKTITKLDEIQSDSVSTITIDANGGNIEIWEYDTDTDADTLIRNVSNNNKNI